MVEVLWPDGWWFLLAVALGGGMAFLAYRDRQRWPDWFRYVVAANRFVLFFLLVLALAGTRLRFIQNREEPPVIGVLLDDSRSVRSFLKKDTARVASGLKAFAKTLSEAGIQTQFSVHDSLLTGLDSVAYKRTGTSLSGLITHSRNRFPRQALRGLVLVTDGRHNQGITPQATMTPVPIHSVGIGDTVNLSDNRIVRLLANRTVQQGNQFPVRLTVGSRGFKGRPFNIKLEFDGKEVARRQESFGLTGGVANLTFSIPAGAKGVKALKATIAAGPGEANLTNNTRTFFVEVADVKTRILLAAAAPHPDLKAIRAALEEQQNLEVHTWYPGLQPEPKGEYNVLVLHRLPDAQAGMPPQVSQRLGGTPAWFIASPGVSIPGFNQANGLLTLGSGFERSDQVNGALNPSFSLFQVDRQEMDKVLPGLPPVTVPYGPVGTNGQSTVLLDQTIGPVRNGKPLWVLGEVRGRRCAAMAGEGIWQWSLQEQAAESPTTVTRKLVNKTIQWLLQDDKGKRFVFRPVQAVQEEGLSTDFEVRVTDQTGQLMASQRVDVTIKGQAAGRSFAFPYNPDNTLARVADLPAGSYTYRAATVLDGRRFEEKGSFSIEASTREDITDGADFGLLRSLSKASGGQFVKLAGLESLARQIVDSKPAPVLRTFQRNRALYQWPPFLWIIIGLFLAELAGRKLLGGL